VFEPPNSIDKLFQYSELVFKAIFKDVNELSPKKDSNEIGNLFQIANLA
jgi:hypothetical protein